MIVPLYNGAGTVEQAINSVLKQDFPRWELLVIDDCSSDRGPELVADFAEQSGNERIRLFRQEYNQGPSAARNLGIREMRGDCAVFLDCDDELLPQALSTLASLLEPDIDVVAAAHIAVSGGHQQSRPDQWQGKNSGIDTLNAALQGKTWNYLHGKLYRREILQEIAFPDALVRYEDLVFNVSAYSYSSTVLFTEAEVYLYHIQQNSLTWSQLPSTDYIEQTLDGVRDGIADSALAEVQQRSWDSLTAFLTVMTYSGGIFSDNNGHGNQQVLKYLRRSLSFRQLLTLLPVWPQMAISAILLKVAPWLYRTMYRWHVGRTFGMKQTETA